MNSDGAVKRGAVLPSPALMIGGDASENDNNDELNSHQGRKRSFPHERGIWASYISVDYSDIDGCLEIQNECKSLLNARTRIDFRPIDRMHLSLTKTFTIRHHNIAPFVDSLQEHLALHRHFRLEFDGLDVYTNEERSRTFVGMRVAEASCGPLESLVGTLDEYVKQYKLPQYYPDRSFHVSFLWCLDDKREETRQHISALTDVFERIYEEEYCDMNQTIRQLCFKCGNKSFYLDLA